MVSFQTKDLKLSYTKISSIADCYLSLKSHVKGELFPLSQGQVRSRLGLKVKYTFIFASMSVYSMQIVTENTTVVLILLCLV